jgi:hypothetical protein
MSEGKLGNLLQNYNGQRIEDRPGACAWYPLGRWLSGAHALWAVCAGRSVRNLCRARVFPLRSPSIKRHPTTLGRNRHEGSRAPPWAPPTRETLGGVLVLAKDKPLSGTRLTARTLGGRARNGRRRWAALQRDREAPQCQQSPPRLKWPTGSTIGSVGM